MQHKAMILRRLSQNLRTQNWTAITIEFLLVVLGVFFAIFAANWNVGRPERQETGRLLSQLDAELSIVLKDLDSMNAYYGVSGRYAARASAGWAKIATQLQNIETVRIYASDLSRRIA